MNIKLDNLIWRMLLLGITIIEHKTLFVGGAIFTEEPDFAMFHYKKKRKLLMKIMALQSSSLTFNLNDSCSYYIYYFYM